MLMDKDSRKKNGSSKKISSFLCHGTHYVFECLGRGKLGVLVIEEDRQEENNIALMTVISAI